MGTTEHARLRVVVLYNSSSSVPSAIGEYKVDAVITDDNCTGVATATLVISAPTAISDHKVAKYLKLYPNPTTG